MAKPDKPRPAKGPRIKSIRFRCELKEFNRIQLLADIYADGNVSRWLRHASANAPRKKVLD